MRYVTSDIHGEYDLFVRHLDEIKFSDEDVLYVCGDIIEKGDNSIKLAKPISSMPNVQVFLRRKVRLNFRRYSKKIAIAYCFS